MYENKHTIISEYIKNRLVPADADHIYVLGHFLNNKASDLRPILDKLGDTYPKRNVSDQDEFGSNYQTSHRYGMYADKILDWHDLKLPSYVLDMRTWKIRINYEDGLFCIFPLAFPDIYHDRIKFGVHTFPICFCERYDNNDWRKNNVYPEQKLTCYCVSIYSQLSLIRSFMKILNKKLSEVGDKFIVDDVIYTDARNKFGDRDLEKEILHLIILYS